MKLKHLLTLALMAVAGSVWAETTVLYEKGTEGHAWSEADKTTWGASELDATYGLRQTGGNGSNSASLTIAPKANSVINVEAYWVGMSNIGRRFDQGNCSYFNYAGVWVEENDQDKASAYSINGFSSSNFTTFTNPTGCANRAYDIATKCWYVIKMQINTATNTLVSLTVESSDKLGTKLVDISDKVLINPDYTKVVFGYLKSGSVSTTNNEYLKSIVIKETTQDVSTGDYTIKYLCGEEEVQESTSSTAPVGTVVTVSHDPVWKDGVKYIYVSDDADENHVASTPVTVTVQYRKAATYNYSVKTSLDAEILSGSNYEGENISYGYARYINVDGTLYGAAKQGSNPWWGSSFVLTENNQVVTVNYTKTDVNNVVYFTETEDIEGAQRQEGGNANVRCSMQAGGYYEGEVTTLQPGKYTITTSVWGGAGGTLTFKAGDIEVLAVATTGSVVDATSEEFLITEPTVISLAGGRASGSSPWVTDFIYIVKTADYATATMSVGAAGYATFCAPFEVAVPAGVTASTATLDGDVVTLTSVGATIPANTPVVLAGTLAETTVSGVATAIMDPTAGVLHGVYSEKAAPVGSYVLQNQAAGVGFYKVEGVQPTVGANRAYLTVPAGENARFFGFGEETAIKAIDALTAGKAEIFDLQGRRLNSLQKGINIVNGVKILVK